MVAFVVGLLTVATRVGREAERSRDRVTLARRGRPRLLIVTMIQTSQTFL
jgi:hypothetical protein